MLWPETTARNVSGTMTIGGALLDDLAREFGTPLYIFDAVTLDKRSQEIRTAVQDVNAEAVFAAKALAIPAILNRLHAAGFGIDVVSAGELQVATASGIAPESLTLHGNNKSRAELALAIDIGVGHIAIDNDLEIEMLTDLLVATGRRQKVLIRVNPGIDVHTHGKIATGVIDSKFGFPIWTADAANAVKRVLAVSEIELVGYHCHLGSQLFDIDAPITAVRKILAFAGEMKERHGYMPAIISPGGGMGIAYTKTGKEVSVTEWVERTVAEVVTLSETYRLPPPQVIFEPGRFLVGQAGVALYEVGARKEIAGVRTYVSVDGGMADNIRPALYGAAYEAEVANRMASGPSERVTIAGKYCESGDILIESIDLPRLEPGDLLALPAAGAYCIPLASNYNMALRPAVVIVEDNEVTVIRRRERVDDLLASSVLPGDLTAAKVSRSNTDTNQRV